MIQQTSLEAFESLTPEGKNKRQKQIMLAIRHLGFPTRREIAEHLNLDPNCVTPRVNELVKARVLKEMNPRMCKVTGYRAGVVGLR